jgi:hypothetical protein
MNDNFEITDDLADVFLNDAEQETNEKIVERIVSDPNAQAKLQQMEAEVLEMKKALNAKDKTDAERARMNKLMNKYEGLIDPTQFALMQEMVNMCNEDTRNHQMALHNTFKGILAEFNTLKSTVGNVEAQVNYNINETKLSNYVKDSLQEIYKSGYLPQKTIDAAMTAYQTSTDPEFIKKCNAVWETKGTVRKRMEGLANLIKLNFVETASKTKKGKQELTERLKKNSKENLDNTRRETESFTPPKTLSEEQALEKLRNRIRRL